MDLTYKAVNYFKPINRWVKIEKKKNGYSKAFYSYSLKNVNLCSLGDSPQITQINGKC